MVVVLMGGAGTGANLYLENKFIGRNEPAPYDAHYVLVAAQNLKLLYAVEDEMSAIQTKVNNGTATQADLQRLATLKERKRNLSE